MASTDDILLKLVIRGMDPAEVKRLADQTYGQLKTEAARHIDELARLHRDKSQAMAEDTKKKVDEQIKAEQKVLQSTQQIMRAQEVAANKAHSAWSRTMEDLENVTTVATGAWRVMSEGFEIFHSLGEEIIRTTQIYNSLHGSIEAMRAGTEGEVADIDLISAKNRGFQKDLKITDEQYGLVAATAKRYADAIGINTKEALDKLVDGMATGRVKMLEHVGVMVKAEEANENWAKAMGTTVEAMTDQEKLTALQTEAIKKMNEKMAEGADDADRLANRMERGLARLKNYATDALAAIGNIDARNSFEQTADYALGAGARDKAIRDKHLAAYDEEHAIFDEGNAVSSKSYSPVIGASREEQEARAKMKMGDPRGDKAREEAAKRRAEGNKAVDDLFNKLGSSQGPSTVGGLDPTADLESLAALTDQSTDGLKEYVEAQDKANEADEKRYIAMEKAKGISVDSALAYEKLASSLGIETEALTQDERMQALASEARVKAAELQEKLQQEADARRAELDATSKRAGFLGVFLFGTDGPDETFKEMDSVMQHTVEVFGEMSGMIGGAAKQMSNALATSIGAAITHHAGWKTILHNQTHDILESLATQAGARAIFEAASALAFLAVGNFPSAAAAGASAAAFGVLAVGAGLGAHALGTVSTAPTQQQQWQKQHDDAAAKKAYGDSQGWGGGTSSSATSSFGSGGQRSSGGAGGAAPAVIINLNNVIGGADTGRAVKNAIEAYQNLTGEQLLGQAA